MKNKDYRELQLSSSQLFFIFLAILILGVVIFLLGVSVGKKQTQIMTGTPTTAQQKAEPAEQPTTPPAEESKEPVSTQPAATTPAPREETQEQPSASGERELYYVQVGAFNRREMALSFADTFTSRGYPAIVLDPSPSDRSEIFRVRIGGYATREEAVEVMNRLQTESSRPVDYFIIRR